MTDDPRVPPEADLIRRCREAAVPAMSRRQAAQKAGISPSQWSDIERGRKAAGLSTVIPVRATAMTLARMARAVGASAAELAASGRQDAADVLLDKDRDDSLRRRIAAIPGLGILDPRAALLPDGQELLPLIAAALDDIDDSGLQPAAQRELTDMFIASLIHDTARRHAELQLILSLAAAPRRDRDRQTNR